jgi:isopenicillin-N N-acyltransferase-like protein
MNIHVSEEVTPRLRGEAFGRANAERVQHTVEVYRRMCDLGAGGRVRASDDEHEELHGIATGAGVDVKELLAVNARTELTSGRHECSVIGDGEILAQNWDWHPDLEESTVLWIVRENGGWFATITEAGMLAKIGMNDAGLGVCLNLLRCSEDGGLDGTPIHLLMRRTLACRNVNEAIGLLMTTRVSASSAVTVATRGRQASVELSPGGAKLVRRSLTHTNHFLEPPPEGTDVIESESSRPRLEAIRSLPLREALRAHPVCQHVDESEPWEDRTATLVSVIMDLRRKRMELAAGQPCTAPYMEIDPAAARSSLSV